MTQDVLPHVSSTRFVTKALERIILADVPSQFTHSFLCALDLPGGASRPVIPFLRSIGFLDQSDAPTKRYLQFRDAEMRGEAAAEGLRDGFRPLYEVDPAVHEADKNEIERLIGERCGPIGSSTTSAIRRSFEALRSFLDEPSVVEAAVPTATEQARKSGGKSSGRERRGMEDVRKRALAEGRREGKAVRDYLAALEVISGQPRRRKPTLTPEELQVRIDAERDPGKRLGLIQKRLDVQELIASENRFADLDALESEFVAVIKPYAERKGLSYTALREAGVPASVLRAAGIRRTRRSP